MYMYILYVQCRVYIAYCHALPSRKAASLGVDEVQYVFLKRVCQVLVELGTSQIARLWVCDMNQWSCVVLWPNVYTSIHVHVHVCVFINLLCMYTCTQWSTIPLAANSHISHGPR